MCQLTTGAVNTSAKCAMTALGPFPIGAVEHGTLSGYQSGKFIKGELGCSVLLARATTWHH
jgi:hypothetical protein